MTNQLDLTRRGQPQLTITPNPARIDQPVHIRLAGFAPDQRVTLQAQMQDEGKQTWRSEATFKADAAGVIDVSTQPPLTGAYTGVDGMGLFWSMAPVDEGNAPVAFSKCTLAPLTVTFTALAAEQIVATATLDRLFIAPGVTCTPVREQGLVGSLFQPAGNGPFPGVLVVGGSEGGIFSSEQRAALLAAQGYAALALAYFALETLPGELVNIPLEYFGTALAWLQRQPTIRGDQVAAVGGSKGGELVLLLATCYPQLKAVVAYLPSNVVWNGVVRGQDDPVQWSSSWSWQGEPLPFLARAPMNQLQEQMARGEAISLRPLYEHPLADHTAMTQAMILVEQSQAAILLISGGDDQFWPSSPMAELVMERLHRSQYPYPFAHLSYPAAGHGIGLPHLPATVNQMRHPIRGLLLRSGGNTVANAQARVDAWARMVEFVGENLSISLFRPPPHHRPPSA